MKNRVFSYVLSVAAGLLLGASLSTSALQYEPFFVVNAPLADRVQVARDDAEIWCTLHVMVGQYADCQVRSLIGYEVETDSSYGEYIFDIYRVDDAGPAHTSLRVLMQDKEAVWP